MPIKVPYERPAYELVEGLREPAQPLAVSRAEPSGWARQASVLRKLGPKAWVRVSLFRNYFTAGWGENGRVLSPRALDAFFRFVEGATFPAGNRSPTVFLTDQGGIELCWEDRNGNSVQVEFTGGGIEYYEAATNEEGAVAFDGLAQLSQRLSA